MPPDIAPKAVVYQSSLMIGIFCIGFSAIFVRLAAVPGLVSGFYRVLIASSFLVPFWLVQGGEHPGKRAALLSITAGLFFGLDLALWNMSVFLTRAANSRVLAYLAPVWIGLISLLVLKEKLKKNYWRGAVLAVFGMFVILGLENISKFRLGLGDILAVVSSFFYAGYLLVAQVARRFSRTLPFTAISVFSSSVMLFMACLARGEKLTGFSQKTWLAFFGLGLISHLLGWYSINYALGYIKASVVSFTLLGQPVVTALAALAFLNEPLRVPQVAGGLILLSGVYIVNRA